MKIIQISLLSIRRQMGKRLLLMMALALCLAAVLSLVIFVQSQERSIEKQFDEYGANIIITPRKEDLSLSYGGITVNSIITDQQELKHQDAEAIYTIANNENIRAVSPKLVGSGRPVSRIGRRGSSGL